MRTRLFDYADHAPQPNYFPRRQCRLCAWINLADVQKNFLVKAFEFANANMTRENLPRSVATAIGIAKPRKQIVAAEVNIGLAAAEIAP